MFDEEINVFIDLVLEDKMMFLEMSTKERSVCQALSPDKRTDFIKMDKQKTKQCMALEPENRPRFVEMPDKDQAYLATQLESLKNFYASMIPE